MDNRLKKKYLKKARLVVRRRKQQNDLNATTPLSESPFNSMLTSQGEEDISMHIETNRELKRLLLASVGSDLHTHIENLVAEKTRLQIVLSSSVSQLDSVAEEADHLSIECDIWRSKFIASRVLIDELARYKSLASATHSELVRSLNTLLGERQAMRRHVALCNTMLRQTLLHLNNENGLFINGHAESVVDVAALNTRATRQLLLSITGHKDTLSSPERALSVSNGEELAQKALASCRSLFQTKNCHSLPHLSVGEKHLLQRTNKDHSRYQFSRQQQSELLWEPSESLTLHYCKNCRGKVLCV